MRGKKTYDPSLSKLGTTSFPYPSKRNPIILPPSFVSGSVYSVKDQLIKIQKRIITNEKDFQRRGDKIPAL